MPQQTVPQQPRDEAQSGSGTPAVLSIREEAALLRAAQAAGTISQTAPTPDELDAFFARRRVRPGARSAVLGAQLTVPRAQKAALKAVEEKWGISFSPNSEEPVPVAGHDWEWRIERQADGA